METANTLSNLFKREIKKAKLLDSTNTLFALYIPERIVIPACELKLVDLQAKIIIRSSMKAYMVIYGYIWSMNAVIYGYYRLGK